jgi:cob(I)alamin adenosyltransferase
VANGGPSATRLYTRTGDRGETGLVGGVRVAKDSSRIRAFGSLDELGAHLGLVRASLGPNAQPLFSQLTRLQHELFIAQSELAVAPGALPPAHRIEPRHVERLEREIDAATATLDPLKSFVLPGGSEVGARLHVARGVARRSEREVWAMHREEPVSAPLLQWLNRLNDLLFALALSANRDAHVAEIPPDYTV